ncbi:hypothetical protein Hanom_Chr14g01320081 [Helianthus anomalus]
MDLVIFFLFLCFSLISQQQAYVIQRFYVFFSLSVIFSRFYLFCFYELFYFRGR